MAEKHSITQVSEAITLPPDFQTPPEKEQIVALIHSVVRAASFSGPLPPPEILAGYDKVLPGAADRIIKMAEKQAQHRQGLESSTVKSDSKRAYLGVVSAFVLSFTAILGGIIAVCLGHDTAGAAISTTGVALLAGTFIYGTIARRGERVEKAKIMAGEKAPDVSVVAKAPEPTKTA